jgi:hypothetical protein
MKLIFRMNPTSVSDTAKSKLFAKTRVQYATPSDKVLRLRAEMSSGLEIVEAILRREHIKRELPQQFQAVWAKRLPVPKLKRQHPGLGSKEDEELLHVGFHELYVCGMDVVVICWWINARLSRVGIGLPSSSPLERSRTRRTRPDR